MPMPTVVGVGAGASGTGDVVAPFPGGYTATLNDIGVIYVERENADTVTAPSGWTIITTSAVISGTTTKLVSIWRRIQGGDTAPTVADNAGNHIGCRMIIVRGCVTSGDPWDITATSQENVADTTVSIPGGTTSVNDCLCLAAFATGQDIASTAGATGWANGSLANGAEQMDNWVAAGTGGGFAMWSGEKATAGVVSATTATLSLTANFKALMFIALKGVAATPTQPPVQRRDHMGALLQV